MRTGGRGRENERIKGVKGEKEKREVGREREERREGTRIGKL